MSVINVNDLSFGYEGEAEDVFRHVTFSLDTDWKLGFIGRNGRGKTTFLNLLMGRLTGQGKIITNVEFDYFPYEVKDKSMSTIDVVETIYPQYEFWELCREWSWLDGAEDVWFRPFETLSNGEQTKVMLAVLFLKPGHFLLIDEPTNHLDIEARAVVRRYLNRKRGFILVSHDRSFLDGCTDHILSINKTNIELVQGNFSSWWENKNRADAHELAENEKLKKDIKRLTEASRQAGQWADKVEDTKIGAKSIQYERTRAYTGEKSRKMQKRRKNLEYRREKERSDKEMLLKNIETAEELRIRPLHHEKNILISAKEVSVCYGDRTVCGQINFTLKEGECMVIKGRNGSGKSSLIKRILGEAVAGGGELKLAAGLKLSYVSQDTSWLTGTLAHFMEEHRLDATLFQLYLRKLDFKRSELNKRMENLSEGQKKKVLLSYSLCQQAHVYVWDEPLNYIDLFSRIQLEELIVKYRPAMILIEHDELFTEKTATKVLSINL